MYFNGRKFVSLKEINTGAVPVETELNESSDNPIANKTVAAAVRKLQEDGVGTPGEDGATFIPSMSEDGILSWTNDKGLANPPPVNVQGPKGEKGEKGDGADVVVDDALDSNSTNPVQNKAVAVPLDHLTSALNSVRSVASVAADEATEAKNSADFALNTANNIGSALSATINRVSTLETYVKELQENGCGGVDITDDGNGNVTITNSPKFEDMRAALDSIIAIQEALIGGGGE